MLLNELQYLKQFDQMIECLSSKCKVPNSNHRTAKKQPAKKKKKKLKQFENLNFSLT